MSGRARKEKDGSENPGCGGGCLIAIICTAILYFMAELILEWVVGCPYGDLGSSDLCLWLKAPAAIVCLIIGFRVWKHFLKEEWNAGHNRNND